MKYIRKNPVYKADKPKQKAEDATRNYRGMAVGGGSLPETPSGGTAGFSLDLAFSAGTVDVVLSNNDLTATLGPAASSSDATVLGVNFPGTDGAFVTSTSGATGTTRGVISFYSPANPANLGAELNTIATTNATVAGGSLYTVQITGPTTAILVRLDSSGVVGTPTVVTIPTFAGGLSFTLTGGNSGTVAVDGTNRFTAFAMVAGTSGSWYPTSSLNNPNHTVTIDSGNSTWFNQ
jgi:hypothetical protein